MKTLVRAATTRPLVVWLGFACAFALLLTAVTSRRLIRFAEIASDTVVARGTVTSLHCANHDELAYAFSVRGVTYAGVGQGCRRTVDRSLVVYYDGRDPSRNANVAPAAGLQNEIAFIAGGTVVMPTFLLIVTRARRRGSLRGPETAPAPRVSSDT